MESATDLDVRYVAKLARLNLTRQETELFQKQLGDVLKYANHLQEIDISGIETTAHVVPVFNVFREDEPHNCFSVQEASSNAPRWANSLFIVPKVVE